MSTDPGVAAAMSAAAGAFLAALPERQHESATYAIDDPARTRWTYMPRPRPGLSLLDLDRLGRKAAHRLLATALSRPAFAQAVTIMGLEEVLDLDEQGRRGRHSDDYWIAVFGEPGGAAWSWRFEGHHLSITATVAAGQVTVAPLFLGANPARVQDGNEQLVVGPLWREEEMARAVMSGLAPKLRAKAVVGEVAPSDILTTTAAKVEDGEAIGVRAVDLAGTQRALLNRLLALFLDRLAPELADQEYRRLPLEEMSFAWAGGLQPGQGHYYQLRMPGLLIEYDNTQRNANHVHTVLRRPGEDFGGELLAEHLAAERERPPAPSGW